MGLQTGVWLDSLHSISYLQTFIGVESVMNTSVRLNCTDRRTWCDPLRKLSYFL